MSEPRYFTPLTPIIPSDEPNNISDLTSDDLISIELFELEGVENVFELSFPDENIFIFSAPEIILTSIVLCSNDEYFPLCFIRKAEGVQESIKHEKAMAKYFFTIILLDETGCEIPEAFSLQDEYKPELLIYPCVQEVPELNEGQHRSQSNELQMNDVEYAELYSF